MVARLDTFQMLTHLDIIKIDLCQLINYSMRLLYMNKIFYIGQMYDLNCFKELP